MRKTLRRRFWLETGIASVTSILLIITLVWREWIEIVFNFDPDNGSGALEWLIVGALLLVTVMLFVLASYEWHRVRTVTS